jgi:putative transposase
MPRYVRSFSPGGAFFFTVVTYEHQSFLTNTISHQLLRNTWLAEMRARPFSLDAICLLPNHLHFIMRFREGDGDYSIRIAAIKARFTKYYLRSGHHELGEKRIRRNKGERAIWQRRFWEHMIRDDDDFRKHMDYIHYNPVKHGLVSQVQDWLWSSFHRYIRLGVYSKDWGG